MVKSKVKTKCIEWSGNITKKGYGQFVMKGITFSAHRVAWLLFNGGGLRSLQVLHKCDNRKCINPEHLFLGTNSENVADRQAKGRQIRGESHPKAKLKKKDVIRIRKLVAKGTKIQALAKEYDVNFSTIFSIIHGKTWNNI